jgi:hypothetical protein
VARRRDTRIFGPGPYVLGLRREGGWGSGFPFDMPAVAAVEEVKLDRLGELPAVPRNVLDGALAPVLSATKPRNGYYLRAESFFNIAKFIDATACTCSTSPKRLCRCPASSRCSPS